MKNRLLPALMALFAVPLFTSSLFAQNLKITIAGPTVVCASGCYTYTVVPVPPAGSNNFTQYFWAIGGSGAPGPTFGDTQSISFCFPGPGFYVLKVSAITPNGSTVSASIDIIAQQYVPYQILSDNTVVCNVDSSVTGGNNVCDKVCPNSTVTYTVSPFMALPIRPIASKASSGP